MVSNLERSEELRFDPSQFKLQEDGTFRISIRGMAAMAGIDFGGLARSLKSAVDENPLPCARSLLAQGIYPVDVATWAETGGIPEDAAPFILEHYGINAASPSAQARAALLAFSRVGINAYLKERLGLLQHSRAESSPRDQQALAQGALNLIRDGMDLMERLGGLDDRDRGCFRDMIRTVTARGAGGLMLPPGPEMLSLSSGLLELGVPAHKASDVAARLGRTVKQLYTEEHGRAPQTHRQTVHGKEVPVCDYEANWLRSKYEQLRDWVAQHMG